MLSFPARIAARYEASLAASPVPTKMATGGALWGLGDLTAQALTRGDGEALDYHRLARVAGYGGLLHAPIAHVHYNFLEWAVVARAKVSPARAPVVKVIVEQFVYWGYLSNAMYHFSMATLEGAPPDAAVERVKDRLWPTMLAQWSFWIPVQYLNFRFIPVRHQLNVVLTTSVAWTAFLSWTFPPEKAAGESAGAGAEDL